MSFAALRFQFRSEIGFIKVLGFACTSICIESDPQGVDIIVRMTKITSHLNDDVVFLQIINSVLMAYPPIGPL